MEKSPCPLTPPMNRTQPFDKNVYRAYHDE